MAFEACCRQSKCKFVKKCCQAFWVWCILSFSKHHILHFAGLKPSVIIAPILWLLYTPFPNILLSGVEVVLADLYPFSIIWLQDHLLGPKSTESCWVMEMECLHLLRGEREAWMNGALCAGLSRHGSVRLGAEWRVVARCKRTALFSGIKIMASGTVFHSCFTQSTSCQVVVVLVFLFLFSVPCTGTSVASFSLWRILALTSWERVPSEFENARSFF